MVSEREEPAEAAAAAATRVEGWIASARAGAVASGDPDLLAGARSDADGFAFTRRLLQALVAVNDPFAAALGLRAVSQDLPASLPAHDRAAVRAGGIASLGLPWAVLPVARRWLRDRVSHLVLTVRPPEAGGDGQSARIRSLLLARAEANLQTLFQLGGEPVLGPKGVSREVRRLMGLARQNGVTHIAVDPGRIAPPRVTVSGAAAMWSLEHDAAAAVETLAQLLEVAGDYDTAIILEPSDYRGALLAPEIIACLLAAREHEADETYAPLGMRLPAELPESGSIAERLVRLSAESVAAGGEPLELTIGTVGLSGREHIASLIDGLAVPAFDERAAESAQLLRLAKFVCASGAGAGDVRVVFETEDPLHLAALSLLAERHGASPILQLRAGTAPMLESALVEHGFAVRIRQPLVPTGEFAGALDSLIGLAAEAAGAHGQLARAAAFAEAVARAEDDASGVAGAFAPGSVLAEARDELARALVVADEPFPATQRTQRRDREWHPEETDTAAFYRPPTDTERLDTGGLTAAVLGLGRDATGQIVLEAEGPAKRIPVVSESGFANEPDTDAAPSENREWARGLLARAAESRTEQLVPGSGSVPGGDPDVGALVEAAGTAGAAWGGQRASTRSARISRLALGAASARDRLIEVLSVETGGPMAVLDAEVSGAIDAARYLGQLSGGLGAVRGAEFTADEVALVVADAGVPLAERAEAVLAALAAGSAVILVAHPTVARSSAALIEEWEAAGLPSGTVTLVAPDPDTTEASGGEDLPKHVELAAALAADPRIARALVHGSRDTARALIRRRPGLQIEGRFRRLGSALIAPSAEPSAAVREAVRSAFGAGAADARSARALILLGSTARSKHLRRQLADAVRGLRVGDSAAPEGEDPLAFDVGPLPEAPDAAGLRALTELNSGEEWLVEPVQLDNEGRLWQPGARLGVRRDAGFWEDAVGMPVIGVISANSLDQAMALQTELGGGSVAALYATDPAETLPWLDGTWAASLTVGGATTAARIERRPVGGWGGSGMGAAPLAGGPHRLVTLGTWRVHEGTASSTLHLRGLAPEVQALVEAAQGSLDYASFDRVRRAALSDALTWRSELGRLRDVIGLGVEWNALRHWPVPTHVRLAEGGSLTELVRVLAAGMVVGAPLTISTGELLPPAVAAFLSDQAVAVSLERDDAWLTRIAVASAGEHLLRGAEAERVRLIGGDPVRAAEWLGGQDRVPLWADPVTMAGPVELLAFLREQSISAVAHRHGLAAPLDGLEEWATELDARVVLDR